MTREEIKYEIDERYAVQLERALELARGEQ